MLSICYLKLGNFVVATVGGVVGMALVLRGGSAVMWHASKSEFPYFQGTLLRHNAWRHCCRCLRRTVSPLHEVLLAMACSLLCVGRSSACLLHS